MARAGIKIELQGPGVEPATVDARALLDLASAIVDIVMRLGEEAKTPVRLTGLEVINKCAAVATYATPSDVAQTLVAQALTLVTVGGEMKRGLDAPVKRARRAINTLPAGHHARLIVGRWKKPLTAPALDRVYRPEATTTLVARPVRVGGQKRTIQFESFSEEHPFTLRATEEECRKIGAVLYRDVEISFTYRRDGDGHVVDGVLDDFRRLDGDATFEDLQTWIGAVAPDLIACNGVLRELGRRD
jgi:hypothetical protein